MILCRSSNKQTNNNAIKKACAIIESSTSQYYIFMFVVCMHAKKSPKQKVDSFRVFLDFGLSFLFSFLARVLINKKKIPA